MLKNREHPFHVVITSFTGQKFSKSLNATLEATVVFTDAKVPSPLDDPFCKDLNAYAQVRKTQQSLCIRRKTSQNSLFIKRNIVYLLKIPFEILQRQLKLPVPLQEFGFHHMFLWISTLSIDYNIC